MTRRVFERSVTVAHKFRPHLTLELSHLLLLHVIVTDLEHNLLEHGLTGQRSV